MAHRVLAISERFGQPSRQKLFREFLHDGYELFVPESINKETLFREAKSAKVIITGFEPVTEELIRAVPELCAVGRMGTGVDMIDIPAATRAGIPVLNSPGSMRSDAIAEHAIMFMLMLSRRPWLWGKTAVNHNELMGATLGIAGLGNIGRALARRCAGFGMEILAHTRTRGKFRPEGFSVEETETLEALLPRADYLVIALPLTEETRGLIGAKEFRLMKDTAFLLNVARGAQVITDDLVAALREEKLAGAGLDVTEPEPLPEGHPLLDFPNVIISPHNSTHSEGVMRRSCQLLCDNIRRAVEGERVTSLANPEVYG